jgi:hypothetical protein
MKLFGKNNGVNMRLDEAKQILKENGFICESAKLSVDELKEGDKLLIWYAGRYQYRPLGIITLLEPDTEVQRSDKGTAWICELQKTKQSSEYYVDEHIAYTHGTYGDAIVYPCVKWKHVYDLTDETEEVSLKFLDGKGEVWFKTEQKNHAFKGSKNGTYYIETDLNLLKEKNWWDYSESGNTIRDPRRLEKIYAEHPELKKQIEQMKTKYYDLHTKK